MLYTDFVFKKVSFGIEYRIDYWSVVKPSQEGYQMYPYYRGRNSGGSEKETT